MNDDLPRDRRPVGSMDGTFLPVGSEAPPGRADVLRLAAYEPWSVVHGPGRRAVLWVAGCLRRCPGCMKPDFFSFSAGADVAVEEVARRVLSTPDLDGVSFSGGEPFEQALPLAALGRRCREAGLPVLVYSGYRLAALRAEARFAPLLAETDLLVDGEYRADLPGPLRWRGSANQVVHVLTGPGGAGGVGATVGGGGGPESPLREVQVSLTAGGLRLSGFPDPATERALAERLRARGVVITGEPGRGVS